MLVPNWFILGGSGGLAGSATAFYAVLLRFAQLGGDDHPSVAELAAYRGASVRTARRAARELERAGRAAERGRGGAQGGAAGGPAVSAGKKRAGFTKHPDWVFDSRLSLAASYVYLVLLSHLPHGADSGVVCPAVTTIAAKAKTSGRGPTTRSGSCATPA